MFTTRTQAVAFLVGLGKPLNLAKVAIDQQYNYESDIDKAAGTDYLYGYGATGEHEVLPNIDEYEILKTYNTFQPMLGFVYYPDSPGVIEGIAVDGELLYNLSGDQLPVERFRSVEHERFLLDPSLEFQLEAAQTKFAIETPNGFWCKATQPNQPSSTPNLSEATTFTWLDQNDVLVECMEEIADRKDAWFKIITVKPAVSIRPIEPSNNEPS